MGLLRAARGALLCAAWYFTIVSGFYILYCPVMYIILIHHKLYRSLADQLFAFWELYPVALFQWCYQTHLHHYGDYVISDENAIFIMNHRTRVDWNYIWIALYHATQKSDEQNGDDKMDKSILDKKSNKALNLRNILLKLKSKLLFSLEESRTKFVLKDEIKNVPTLGWVMQLNYFLYVKRNWHDDKLSIKRFLSYHSKMSTRYRLVLFPEGTDLTESNRRKSDSFASANNFTSYNFVLHPRTTGWAVLSSELLGSGLNAVYDVTVAYDVPAQTEVDLLRGSFPKHAYFCFKRYPVEHLPREEKDLRSWINERWKDKEESLRSFHDNGNFVDPWNSGVPVKRLPRSLLVSKVAFLLWSIIDLCFIYFLIKSNLFQFWVIYHSIFFIIVTLRFGGFHNLQYRLLGIG